MCICINCKHIDRCNTYEFIKKQHNSIIGKKNNETFYPSDTIICISIKKYKNNFLLDWDLQECSSFVEEPGHWLQ